VPDITELDPLVPAELLAPLFPPAPTVIVYVTSGDNETEFVKRPPAPPPP
jgi:hypothetical protein